MEVKNATLLFYILDFLELEKRNFQENLFLKISLNFSRWNMSNLVLCVNRVKISQLVYNNQQRHEGIS